jgi:hypothetical protein
VTDQDQTAARERAARAAFKTALSATDDTDWNRLGARQIEHWARVVDAVAAELGAVKVGAAPVVVPRSTRPWRQGRKVPNHVYFQAGDEPTDTDRWVGSFPVAHDALIAVTAVNAVHEAALATSPPVAAELGTAQEARARVKIDLNIRVRRNWTFVGIEDVDGSIEVGQVVEVFESESGVVGVGQIQEIDVERQIVYLSVEWGSLKQPSSITRGTGDG